ncbi:MAG: ParB/RepB/Spo0J family partition protein, partial [Clostridia bacterium]|nr:ParB/RepB/Spo0J family partition protein [Clostridia bacterium]
MALFDLLKTKKTEHTRALEEVAVSLIVPNPAQPRKTFDEESINELARSIEQVGLIQPIVVRKNGPTFELISGERRLRAIKSLGWEKVLCIVDRQTQDADSALMAVIENLQREDLNFFEESESYRTLLDELQLTQDELALRLGKSQSFIANKLRLLKLDKDARDAVAKYNLTERHARAVLKLDSDEQRLDALVRIGEGRLSVHESERLVDRMLNEMFDRRRSGAKPRPVIVRLVKDYRVFMNTVNVACDQLRSGGVDVDVDQTDREDGVD